MVKGGWAMVMVGMLMGCGGGQVQAASPASDEDDSALHGTTYVDIVDWLGQHDSARQEHWFDLKDTLTKQFDDICGDTFCEGDYPNLTALTLQCSVEPTAGKIKQCLWIFAGSYETLRPGSGTFAVHSHVWSCAIPVNATAAELVDALSAPGSLQQPLPNAQGTLYDALGTCFSKR